MQNKKTRVAMIGHKFIPSRDGGVEVVVSTLAPQLAKTGYDVTCYNRTNRDHKKLRKSGTWRGSTRASASYGRRSWTAAEELYSNAYLYVLPSDLEGMPLTLLEAMNYGCCCMTSDIGECTDVIDGCGVTFLCGNAEALRHALQDLCDHPEKAEEHREKARKVIRRGKDHGIRNEA